LRRLTNRLELRSKTPDSDFDRHRYLHSRFRTETDDAEGYEAYRDRKAKEARAMSLAGREIGEMPAVVEA